MAYELDPSAFQKELTGNILPFWIEHVKDPVHGGFHGAVTETLQVREEVPRSAILCGRILWTYSAAARVFPNQEYIDMATHAFNALTQHFLDPEYGGVYWSVDAGGKAVFDRKHHYAQAFAIYGLAEHTRLTGDPRSLELAQNLFHLLEEHACEPEYGGYIEGSSRDWSRLADMRLGDNDLNCRKSMNTQLHILEAYTNLLRAWEDASLREQHRRLLETFLDHLVDPQSGHFKLFFDDHWNSLAGIDSYGHDIEGSWLLWEAAELHPQAELRERTREASLQMAEAVLREGMDPDGSLRYEGGRDGHTESPKEWWAQAEAVVGFYNAWQLSGEERFLNASARAWEYIQARVVDRVHGDWHKRLRRDGTPLLDGYKAGPWECPYHHGRMCLEMLQRIEPICLQPG